MKKVNLIFIYVAAFSIVACSTPAITKTAKHNCEGGWYKTVQLEVLKVFFAKDGDAIYKACLVKWKGQEVVVSDSLARTNYHVGDIITLIAMAHSYPDGKESYGILSFEAVAPNCGGNKQ